MGWCVWGGGGNGQGGSDRMNDKEFRLRQWFSASVQCQNDHVSHQSNAVKGNHGAPLDYTQVFAPDVM